MSPNVFSLDTCTKANSMLEMMMEEDCLHLNKRDKTQML